VYQQAVSITTAADLKRLPGADGHHAHVDAGGLGERGDDGIEQS
jgi:hypothetical protein